MKDEKQLDPTKITKKAKAIVEVNNMYACPLYKTTSRFGTLSTTGHSTNYILPINLACPEGSPPSKFTLLGTALLTQLTD